MLGVGFEPTPPERIELEPTALDHSAIQALCIILFAKIGHGNSIGI